VHPGRARPGLEAQTRMDLGLRVCGVGRARQPTGDGRAGSRDLGTGHGRRLYALEEMHEVVGNKAAGDQRSSRMITAEFRWERFGR
jgi:hypothetical protein